MNKELHILTKRGLERRLKRYCFNKAQIFFAVTTPGFESIVASEIAILKNTEVKEQFPGGVEFYAPFETVYDANLNVRSSNRILMRIASFTARSYPELYNKAKRIQWELFCGFSTSISFSVSSRQSRLHHTDNISRSVADAIKEHMHTLGVTIQCVDNATICFYIRFCGDQCTISIDSSGDLLYKRGYRTSTSNAPIRETIAAAILMAMQWNRYSCIVDPLCGSGTFLLEAALLSINRAPGYSRSFAFETWPSFNEVHWQKYRKKSAGQVSSCISMRLCGSDIDQGSLDAASQNAKRLNVSDSITLSIADCLQFNSTGDMGNQGLIISNLPYGKRVDTGGNSNEEFIRKFGRHLRRTCRGWDFAFVAAHEQFGQLSGLHVTRTIRFSNGGIPVAVFMGCVRDTRDL